MLIEIEALLSGVRVWREFASPVEARKWARSEGVDPLVVVVDGEAVSLGRFLIDAVIARWPACEFGQDTAIEFPFN